MATHTGPPGTPARMTDAELKVTRVYLGLTRDWLAAHLGVSPRDVRLWEQGERPIPHEARSEIRHLEQRATASVDRIVQQMMDMPEPAVMTYRNDADYRAAHPDASLPASAHRAIVARVAQEVPGLIIEYWTSHTTADATVRAPIYP